MRESPSERLLWSNDSRYLLIVGKNLVVAPDALTDTGEQICLLYDAQKHEMRCNSTQVNERFTGFGFNDLSRISLGEKFRPRKVN